MTSQDQTITPPAEPALLLGRVARLREEWRLSPADVRALFGLSEASIVGLAVDCGGMLADRVEERVRLVDEIASLAWSRPDGPAPAEWLRAPDAALHGRSPLDVLASGRLGLVEVRRRLFAMSAPERS